jgi:hypothetical protein
MEALGAYHNADGGFGNALEPDVRAGESSALATSVAFQTLRALETPPDSPIVSRAIAYLVETFDSAQCHWRIIPLLAEGSPHAPWWNQTDREGALDRFSLNPTAELLGYLIDYSDLVPAEMLAQIGEKVAASVVQAATVEMHELLCVLRLLQTRDLGAETRGRLLPPLQELVHSTVTLTRDQWQAYGLRPLQVVDGPESPLISGLEDAVQENILYEIESQNPDGSWTPTWSWGDAYPEQAPVATAEWKGILTLEKLLQLRAFGAIQGI